LSLTAGHDRSPQWLRVREKVLIQYALPVVPIGDDFVFEVVEESTLVSVVICSQYRSPSDCVWQMSTFCHPKSRPNPDEIPPQEKSAT